MVYICFLSFVLLQLMTSQMDMILLQSMSLVVNERSERTGMLPRHSCGFQNPIYTHNLSRQTQKLDLTCRNRYISGYVILCWETRKCFGFISVISPFFCFCTFSSLSLSLPLLPFAGWCWVDEIFSP